MTPVARRYSDAGRQGSPVPRYRAEFTIEPFTEGSPGAKVDAAVDKERMREGAIGHSTVWENLLLTDYDSRDYLRYGLFDFGAIRRHAGTLVEDFDIRTPSLETPGGNLSGGNNQKLIMSREISASPKVLLASQPTRGVDIGAAEYIHKRLIRQRDGGSAEFIQQQLLGERARGTAILMISEDLDEAFGLSDRIAVMYEGRIMGIVDPASATREDVGLMMAGVAADDTSTS